MPNQSPTTQDILNILDRIAPFATAESWDNSGLMIGTARQKISSILLALDPSLSVIDEAIRRQCDAIITHHPLFFRPLRTIDTGSPTGEFINRAMRHQLVVISCHTNLDLADIGVNQALAEKIGLGEVRPLAPNSAASGKNSFGRIGRFPAPLPNSLFTSTIMRSLGQPILKIAGTLPEVIATVAVCGGSGSEMAEIAYAMGADAFLSSEIKLSTARWAEEISFCIIDAGHFATEQVVLDIFAKTIREMAVREDYSLRICRTENQADPFRYISQNDDSKRLPLTEVHH